MATENNSQINTFVKGMNTDTSYLIIDSQGYTFAKNLRINSVSSTESLIGNNRLGEIKPIRGITEMNSAESYAITYNKCSKILAAKSIRQYGIVITQAENGDTYVFRFTNKIGHDKRIDNIDSELIDEDNLHQVFGPYKGPTNVENISIDLRYEDDDNIKLYIADSIHPVLVLNVAPSQDEYNENLDGKIDKISSYPLISFTPAEFVDIIGGNLKPALVQYSYRLYNKNGVATEISPTTKLIPIVDKNGSDFTRRTKGLAKDEVSTSGVRIRIKLPEDSEYLSNLQLYRITYLEQGVLSTIEQIGDYKIANIVEDSEGYIYINDVGQSALSTLTYEEYNSISGIHIIPRVIESMHDRLFAANIKEQGGDSAFQEDIKNLDTRAYSCDPNGVVHLFDYRSGDLMYTFDITQSIPDLTEIPFEWDCYNKYTDINIDYADSTSDPTLYDNGGWDRFCDDCQTYGGTGKVVSWKFVYRNIYLDTNEVEYQTGLVTSCDIKTQEYGTKADAVYSVKQNGTIETISISDTNVPGETYADPKTVVKYPSLRHNEIYRYGIVFYNKNGESSPVKWIADIRTPSAKYTGWAPFTKGFNDVEMTGKAIGINFTVDTHELPLSVVAYEIVRCNRSINDIKAISLGVVSRPIKSMSTVDDNPYMPTGFLTTANLQTGGWYTIDGDQDPPLPNTMVASTYDEGIYQLVTPELVYLRDYMTGATLSMKLELFPISYLYPLARDAELFDYEFFINNGGTDHIPEDTIWPSYTNLSIPFNNSNTSKFFTVREAGAGRNVVRAHIPAYTFFIPADNFTPLVYYRTQYATYDQQQTPAYDPKLGYRSVNGNIIGASDAFWNRYIPVKKNAFAYVKLYNGTYNVNTTGQDYEEGGVHNTIVYLKRLLIKINIDDIKFPDNLQWNDGYDGDTTGNHSKTYTNHITAVGTHQYVNWSAGGSYNDRIYNSDAATYVNNIDSNIFDKDGTASQMYMQGVGGSCCVIQANTDQDDLFTGETHDNHKDLCSFFGTFLCDVRQRYITPYGGSDEYTRSTNTYYSYGDYHLVNEYNTMVFDGDCYPNVMEYISLHKFYTPLDKLTGVSTMIAYSFPVYSTINLVYTHGNEFSKTDSDNSKTNLLMLPASVYDAYVLTDPLYVYNTAYSSLPNTKLFTSVTQDVANKNDEFDYRCYYSNLKINDERIDNWTKFMPANYIDVDTRYGQITHMRNFHNQLVYWQECATGLFSVNERTAITDNNNMPLILGDGGVLSRYDYLDQTAGMAKDQFCDTLSSTTLYWFDDHNLAIRAYREKTMPANLTKINYVQSIMNKDSDKDKNPKLFFDYDNNELIANVLTDGSIVYNENLQAFTAIYTIPFIHYVLFHNGTYVFDNYSNIELGSNYLGIAQWDYNHDEYVRSWDNLVIGTELLYVVNKSPQITKVFDNQEIVSPNLLYDIEKLEQVENKENIDPLSYFSVNHRYNWKTDLNEATDNNLLMTAREGNYRFAVSRASNKPYGDRVRGKYMVSTIYCDRPLIDASIAFIITKFRASWS